MKPNFFTAAVIVAASPEEMILKLKDMLSDTIAEKHKEKAHYKIQSIIFKIFHYRSYKRKMKVLEMRIERMKVLLFKMELAAKETKYVFNPAAFSFSAN